MKCRIVVVGVACLLVGCTEGPVGPRGPAGERGPVGPTGETGPAGAAGSPGASVEATPLEVGDETCRFGGTRFEVEGAPSRAVCNGRPGEMGPPGPSSIAACPPGYTSVDFPNSRLCIFRDTLSETWNRGQMWCDASFHGASLCTHQQLRRACRRGFALVAGTWLADRIGENQVLFVNATDCADFDGVANPSVAQPATYCCLEWMKY